MMEHFEHVVELIREERKAQKGKGKTDYHEDGDWLSILVYYLGQATKRMFAGEGVNTEFLVKALAVGIAWLEQACFIDA